MYMYTELINRVRRNDDWPIFVEHNIAFLTDFTYVFMVILDQVPLKFDSVSYIDYS